MRLLLTGKTIFSNRHSLRAAIKQCTKVSRNHLTPEIQLHLITPECYLWSSKPEDCMFNEPYWAFYWAGGQSLSRFILDNNKLIYNKNVIDIGSGGGACAIAAAFGKAKSVIGNDLDAVACEAISMNCKENGAKVHVCSNDLIGHQLPSNVDILLIGDMFYDTDFGEKLFNWLITCKKQGVKILIGDPGRHALCESKKDKLFLLKEYSLLDHTVLENNGFKSSYVWEM